MKKSLLITIFSLALALAMSLVNATNDTSPGYHHDARAGAIADALVVSMGGREAYDKTRYLSWNFFGKRFHIWDKHTGDIRIEFGDQLQDLILMNIHTQQGQWWQKGTAVTEPAALQKKLAWGYKMWINDSYWLVMPFKLHDPGVNLSYTRTDTSPDGKAADVLTMTFNEVGVTPNNKYELYIDQQQPLVTAFAFYPSADSETPKFKLPWRNYQQYGAIQLSDSRGGKSLAPINAYETIAPETLQSPAPARDSLGKLIPKQ